MRFIKNRYIVLLVLTLVYVFNFIDRQILGILAPYIQAELQINDAQLGMLAGLYFALFYTLVGLPVAWLADRSNRVTLISVSLAFWSLFTAASGLAQNYLQLALARIGVGIGESGSSPASHSLISDLFDKNERPRALAIYSLGIPVGIMLAYFATAVLLGNEALNWRTLFVVLGLPGILVAIAVKLLIVEPERGALDTDLTSATTTESTIGHFIYALRHLLKIPSYWGLCLGAAFASFVGYSVAAFIVLYFKRSFPQISTFNLLILLGIANGPLYGLGIFLGGYVSDYWGSKTRSSYALIAMAAISIGTPCLLLAFWVSNLTVAILLISGYLLAWGCYLGPTFATVQTLAPLSVRATASAIFFFILNIIGLGAGPTVVGYLSDSLQPHYGEVIGLRLALTALVFMCLLAIGCFFWAAIKLPRDWAQAELRR